MVPILAVLVLSIGASLAWLYRQQRSEMLERAREETKLLSKVTKAGLRGQMLRNTEDLTQETIELVSDSIELEGLAVLAKDGVVRYSDDPAAVGEQIDLDSPTCAACHGNGGSNRPQTVEVHSATGARVLRSMSLIENEPECRSCHTEGERYLGMLILDRALNSDLLRIGNVQRSLVGIGSTALLAIVGLVFLIVQRLVQRPVNALIDGTRRIRTKDFETRIEVGVEGELGELGGAFNAMVADTRTHLQEIENKRFELSTLYAIVDRVTRSIDLEHLRKIILDIVGEAFADVEAALIAIRTVEGGEIYVGTREAGKKTTTNVVVDPDELERAEESVDAALLRRWLGGEISERRVSADGRRADVPLRPNGRDIGLLSVIKSKDHGFEEVELHLLDALEAHVSVALENARLYSLAITDELTRAYTLRYFQTSLEEEVGRHERYGQRFALLMIDIDDFKNVNDTHGHLAGDEALKKLVRMLKEAVREVDIVCRYGGEEFAVILPAADRNAARVVGERIRSAIETSVFDLAPDTRFRLTVSVGSACCPVDAKTARNLVETADDALYEAKRAGKNRLVDAGVGD